ncbi:hypothetical protein E2C01_083704 [Portunus trituberculatus]|uniref:Uncharacterized protein n=1 Tax=Portunus trituberculatus TaxID=210409 RepID=A0A5B7J2V7_PORTR|nr:hypothetical protein [Portunus trituberculatus]
MGEGTRRSEREEEEGREARSQYQDVTWLRHRGAPRAHVLSQPQSRAY